MTQEQLQEIADAYYATLDISDEAKAKPQFCVCMIGLVGSGKSTVLKKICQRIPMAKPSADEIRKILYERNLPTDDAPTIGGLVAERLKHEGYNVAHDNDFSSPFQRSEMHKRNLLFGVQELWIRIQPPEEFIINKLTTYKHTYLFKDSAEALEIYYKRKQLAHEQKAELDKLPYLYTFDPSRSDLDNQVDEAVALIHQRLRGSTLDNTSK